MSKTHKAAIWYARHGWYVVPLHAPMFDNGNLSGCTCELWRRRAVKGYNCTTPGKHPILSEWETKASTDLDIIADWWRRFPWANVGIATGKSGILAFDIDSYKDTYNSDNMLTNDDEQTVTNLSGSGGSHLLYKINTDDDYGNAKGTLPDGIDIRCKGGQIVVPPSIHSTGKRYQWEVGYGPHEINAIPLPRAIRDILDAQKNHIIQQVTFGDDVTPPNVDHLHIRSDIVKLIHEPPERGGRSEADQSVITALVFAGATNEEIKAIFEYYPIGRQGKFAEKGTHALRYLLASIAHARSWVQLRREETADKNTANFFVAMAG
ncbi:MAG TPA: bifunctional DNA primase/polymerase [Pseudomonadales bacterium]|nr:bifunctional DNA primase/polymerase [Pseudomonadales bacterium]